MHRTLAVAALVVLAASAGWGRTKLAALPERLSVTVRLDNPSGTLLEEERVLALQAGENQVDFSWQGVRIDPESIRLTFLSHPDQVRLLSVSYPPAEEALVWRIHAGGSWQERVRISYLLADVDRLFTYKALVARDEATLRLDGFLVLRNFSGEDLAPLSFDLGDGPVEAGAVAHEETLQFRVLHAEGVPIRKTLTWDAAEQPWEPKRARVEAALPVHYTFRNDAASQLGGGPLGEGKVRVFQESGNADSVFLGEDQLAHTPRGTEARVYVGDSREVSVTQRKVREARLDPRPSAARVRLYDTDEEILATVENFKAEPLTVDLVQHIPGQWEMAESSSEYERRDAETVVFRVAVPAGASREVRFRYHRRNVRP